MKVLVHPRNQRDLDSIRNFCINKMINYEIILDDED